MISERAEILRTAQLLVPLLALPMVVGALWLALRPHDMEGGAFLLAAGAASMAWYLLGGAISARHVIKGLIVRRELGQAMPQILAHHGPALAVGPDGLILAQNAGTLETIGDLIGRQI